MDEQHEQELLLHVATGTALLTAFAALPRESETSNEPQSALALSLSAIVWIVVAIVCFVGWLLMW